MKVTLVMKVTSYEGFEHSILENRVGAQTNQAHRQNLVAKPANLHNPITYVIHFTSFILIFVGIIVMCS